MEKLINPLVKPMTAGEKYRAGLAGKSTRVAELEKRLKFPKVGRGVGTVNQKGLEKMIAGGREPSREMLRIPQILKGTNEAYESIAQKAIKAAGKTPKKRGGR